MAPTLDQRLAQRKEPSRSPVLLQKWTQLLFLHWIFDPVQLQALLPEGLTVDTYQGKAYVGIVPFFMENIRTALLSSLPGLNFYELNVRTYIFTPDGTPGVWFFSLDASSWLAVQIAKWGFHLPYQHSNFQVERGDFIDYSCKRTDFGSTRFIYRLKEATGVADPETLEFFLIERYLFFAADRSGKLYRGQVYHHPYALCETEVDRWDAQALSWNNLDTGNRAPDHLIASPGIQVRVYGVTTFS